jgi:hypothetical protein
MIGLWCARAARLVNISALAAAATRLDVALEVIVIRTRSFATLSRRCGLCRVGIQAAALPESFFLPDDFDPASADFASLFAGF